MIAKTLLLLVAIIFWGCDDDKKPNTNFYHWKQSYTIPANEPHKPTYIKIMDISTDGAKNTKFTTQIVGEIVPIIYIDNQAMKKLDINSTITAIMSQLKTTSVSANYSYDKVGLDCDWSEDSRAKYFDFLKILKQNLHKKIEATLRLHQIKYANKTGVPPCDSGVLMYYNMSDFRDTKSKNYILDNDIGAKYMSGFDSYPLRLDLALPLYSQATIIRFYSVVGLITPIYEISPNWKKIDTNLYLVTKTHYYNERLLYKNDKIRIDRVTIKDLKTATRMLKKEMKKVENIIFFEWSDRDNYTSSELSSLW